MNKVWLYPMGIVTDVFSIDCDLYCMKTKETNMKLNLKIVFEASESDGERFSLFEWVRKALLVSPTVAYI